MDEFAISVVLLDMVGAVTYIILPVTRVVDGTSSRPGNEMEYMVLPVEMLTVVLHYQHNDKYFVAPGDEHKVTIREVILPVSLGMAVPFNGQQSISCGF